MHLVVVFGFQLVVSLVVGFVVLGRFGEFAVVIRDLLLQIGQRRFDRFDRLAELAQEFFLLFLLFEVRVEPEENVFPMVPAGAPVSAVRLE